MAAPTTITGSLVSEARDSGATEPQPGLLAAHSRIQKCRDLIDDWDGEGGVATGDGAADRATQFLNEVAVLAGEMFAPPAVAPDGDGGLGLSWDLPAHRLLVLIPAAGRNLVLVDAPGESPHCRLEISLPEAIARTVSVIRGASA